MLGVTKRIFALVICFPWFFLSTNAFGNYANEPAKDQKSFAELVDIAAKLAREQLNILDIHLQYIENPEQPKLLFLRQITEEVIRRVKAAKSIGDTTASIERALRVFEAAKISVSHLAPRASTEAFERVFQITVDIGLLYDINASKPMTTRDTFQTINERLNKIYGLVKNTPGKENRLLAKKLPRLIDQIDRSVIPVATAIGDTDETNDQVKPVSLKIRALYDLFDAVGKENTEIHGYVQELEGVHESFIDVVKLEKGLQRLLRVQVQKKLEQDKLKPNPDPDDE